MSVNVALIAVGVVVIVAVVVEFVHVVCSVTLEVSVVNVGFVVMPDVMRIVFSDVADARIVVEPALVVSLSANTT